MKTVLRRLLGISSLRDGQQALSRGIAEVRWGQVFDFSTRNSEWFTNQQMSPGRWAMGFPGLYVLFRVLNEVRPTRVLEFGLGETTKMLLQYASHYPSASLTVIEQDAAWADLFVARHPPAREHIRVLPAVLTHVRGQETTVYEGLLDSLTAQTYDFILVDGPKGSPRYSRHQIVDLITADRLADQFAVIFDDANREGEMETLHEVFDLLASKGCPFAYGRYQGEKDCVLVCSAALGFLTTL